MRSARTLHCHLSGRLHGSRQQPVTYARYASRSRRCFIRGQTERPSLDTSAPVARRGRKARSVEGQIARRGRPVAEGEPSHSWPVRSRDRPSRMCRDLSQASTLSARNTTLARCLSRFLLTAMSREEVLMFNFTNNRSTNAFADLEAQLRALGASGDRLVEATSSLRASARIFAAASARLSASSTRYRSQRPALKLV